MILNACSSRSPGVRRRSFEGHRNKQESGISHGASRGRDSEYLHGSSSKTSRDNRDTKNKGASPVYSANQSSRDPGSQEMPKPQKSRKRFDQTTITLHERFTSEDDEPFAKPREVISIDIERNITGNDEAVIPDLVNVDHVVVVRRKNEGVKLLHKRPEFVTMKEEEEYTERRVIRLQAKPDPAVKENFAVTRDRGAAGGSGVAMLTLSDRWKLDVSEDLSIEQPDIQVKSEFKNAELDRLVFLLRLKSHLTG